MKVEIWSDIVCPWCYIGKRRWEAGLSQFAHRDEVDVVWRSFELNPQAEHHPGERLSDMLAQKYGMTAPQVDALHDQMTALAAAEGLEYHLDTAQPGNTFDAHRTIHLAAHHGRQEALKERLLRAYFSEGRPIGDRDTLVELATDVGLEAGDVRAALESGAYAQDVRADERRAAQFGIQGVPFFAIDETYGISGAQPAEQIWAVLDEAWAASHEASLAGAPGTSAR